MTKLPQHDDLTRQVELACRGFLRAAVVTMSEAHGSAEVPMRNTRRWVMEPSGPGRYSGKVLTIAEPDFYSMFHDVKPDILAADSYHVAEDSIQEYIDTLEVKPASFMPHDIMGHFLMSLLRVYLESVGALRYDHRKIGTAIRALVRHLGLPEVMVLGFIALEGFGAARQFRLAPGITIRPIEEKDLVVLGTTGDSPWGSGHSTQVPRTDWWLYETRLSNPRGTANGWNRIHDIVEELQLALRAFKRGGVTMGFLTHQIADPFSGSGTVRGGRLDLISSGETQYYLSAAEIPRFVKFWRNLVDVLEQPSHYLQVPLRRLHTAGARQRRVDALIDLVIGLEALLGTKDEQTELGYRFRVRGSVLLAKNKAERRVHLQALRKLYALRSIVVHGGAVSNDDLEEHVPRAEAALREVWRWFFRYWRDATDNRPGIDRIDELLLG